MRILADVVVDLQYGDCGKGKVSHHLARNNSYTHVLRYNGGCNAGHTIFHKGKKFVTHHIPAGVFFGIRSVIGPGCVVDVDRFLVEISGLEAGGIKTKGKVFIARNTHVIQQKHRTEDGMEKKIGTTGRGNGPAYRDKYGRTGVRAEHIAALKPYLTDLYEEFFLKKNVKILAEGAQGFGLDIDWGDYPFVTSSHCTVGGAVLNGIPASAVRQVWGIAKVYETYVGAKKFQPKGKPGDEIFNQIAEAGEEYGSTTGRRRQVNWMNMQLLEKAIRINGVTHLVFNKVDVLRAVQRWAVIDKKKIVSFKNEEAMKEFILKRLKSLGLSKNRVFFSESKETI
jgi:adenylosuccinate synthase